MRHLRRALGLFLLVTALVMGQFVGTPDAQAHTGEQSYLFLDVADELRARLQMPYIDLDAALGLELEAADADGDIEAAVAAAAGDIASFALDSVRLGDDAAPWALEVAEVVALTADDGPEYVEVIFDVAHPNPVPREFDVALDPFFDEIDNRDALALIATDWESGVYEDEGEELLRFTPGSRVDTIQLDNPSWTKNFWASIQLGFDHIKTGPDHILFIFALLLPSVWTWKSGWIPQEEFGSSFRRIIGILSMFTLAHSVTFTLAGFNLLPDPGAVVTETVIALSIAATALHNLRPIFPNKEWTLAFLFGLFHGLGFASFVDDLQVATSTKLISLLGRNIGIEIGQIAIVALVFPALYIARATVTYRKAFVVGQILLILASIGWALERTIDFPAVVSKVADTSLEVPRGLLIPLVMTIAAVAVVRFEGGGSDPAVGS